MQEIDRRHAGTAAGWNAETGRLPSVLCGYSGNGGSFDAYSSAFERALACTDIGAELVAHACPNAGSYRLPNEIREYLGCAVVEE